jgi:hypothetical protein
MVQQMLVQCVRLSPHALAESWGNDAIMELTRGAVSDAMKKLLVRAFSHYSLTQVTACLSKVETISISNI